MINCKMGFLIVTDFIKFFGYWSGGFDSLESSTHNMLILPYLFKSSTSSSIGNDVLLEAID